MKPFDLRVLVLSTTLILIACGPALSGKNTSTQFLEALGRGDEAAVQRLLGAGATLVTLEGVKRNPTEQVAMLSSLGVDSTLVEAHHEVARVTLPDGRLVFVQGRNGSVVVVAVFPPATNDERTSALKHYQDAWNVNDSAGRAALLNKAWSNASRYVDPSNDVQGVPGLDSAIEAFQRMFPKTTVDAPSSRVVAISDGWFVADWELHAEGGDSLSGFDVGRTASDGMVESITGFFSARSR